VTTSSTLIALACLAAGIALGAFFVRWLSPQERERRELTESLHRQQTEAAAYQQQVTEHFIKTSELVHNLAQSYREVHQHLALGAMHLANPEVGRSLLTAVSGQLELTLDEQSSSQRLEAPRDYSPKKGALNPGYGFYDDASPTQPNDTTRSSQPRLTPENDDDPTFKVG